MMVLAQQAIEMTNNILEARRSNMVKKHCEGRESLDLQDKFTFEPTNVEDYSAFMKIESPKRQAPMADNYSAFEKKKQSPEREAVVDVSSSVKIGDGL